MILTKTRKHAFTTCPWPNCSLDCAKLTDDIVSHARNQFIKASKRGINAGKSWLNLYIRPVNKKQTDANIWSNHVRSHTQPGREHWKCTYCKCNPDPPPPASIADTNHKFKAKTRRDSKFAACPVYSSGILFKKSVVADTRSKSTRHRYFVPAPDKKQFEVHLTVFRSVFNVGWKKIMTLQRSRRSNEVDQRAVSSGRRSYTHLREKIEKFWLEESHLYMKHH